MDAAGKGARISDATLLEEVLASRKELSTLTDELAYAHERAAQAVGQKERLAGALQEARDQITALKEEVDKLCAPPSTYGVYLSANEDGTVNILSQGRKVKVKFSDPTSVYGPAGPPVILRIEMCSWPSLAEVRKTRLPAAATATSTPAGSV